MAALSRMAASIHKKVTIKPNDTIIFSSNPIPGNEKAVSKVINELSMKGAKVIFQDVHVSGHACQEEIKLIYSLVKPKYAIPVHGEYRHLIAQKHASRGSGHSQRKYLYSFVQAMFWNWMSTALQVDRFRTDRSNPGRRTWGWGCR